MKGEVHAEMLQTERALAVVGEFQQNIVAALNCSLSATVVADQSGRSKLYNKTKRVVIADFAADWLQSSLQEFPQQRIIIELHARAVASLFVAEYLWLLHCSLKHRGSESFQQQVSMILSEALSNPFPSELIRQECLYYIAGWLLCAAGKEGNHRAEGTLKSILLSLAIIGHEISPEKRADLPTGKVRRAERYGGLKFPTRHFYRFVAAVKKVCETMLVNRSLVLFLRRQCVYSAFQCAAQGEKNPRSTILVFEYG